VNDEHATRAATVDPASLYERTRREFIALLLGLSEAELRARVPATPEWSVRDVLAHVAGLARDLNAERFPAADDIGGGEWTKAQVERARDLSLPDLVAEWDREAPKFEAGLRAFGYELGSHFLADLYVHVEDVRAALGFDPTQDELAVAVALDHYLGYLSEHLAATEWGTLDVVAGEGPRTLGREGRHHARLSAEPAELLRVVSGRRSADQIRALDCDGDVDSLLSFLSTALVGGYAMPESVPVE
jgi:uncharacterized protein (TIGR03083 family)